MSDLTIEVKNDAMLGRLNEKELHLTLIEQQKEIEKLNNIIKEVREYIEKENIKRFGNPTIEMALSIRKDKLLEILDKGE